MSKRNDRKNDRKNNNKHRINKQIRHQEIRLVGDNVDTGIYSINEALEIADRLALDLVEISPNANPPVCKVIDYKKFLYEQKKREKEIKNNQKKTVIKEVRFTPNTGENDINTKLKQAKKFLEKGEHVKASVFFKGRQMQFKEKGEVLLLEFVQELQDYGVPDGLPKMVGKRLIINIKPKKKWLIDKI